MDGWLESRAIVCAQTVFVLTVAVRARYAGVLLGIHIQRQCPLRSSLDCCMSIERGFDVCRKCNVQQSVIVVVSPQATQPQSCTGLTSTSCIIHDRSRAKQLLSEVDVGAT